MNDDSKTNQQLSKENDLLRQRIQDLEKTESDLKQSKEALCRSEEKYRSIVETTAEWIWEMDLTGRHTFSNRGVTAILGYSLEEFMGQSTFSFLHEEDRPVVKKTLLRLITEKRGWKGWILRWRHKVGTYLYLESNASPLINTAGECIGFIGTDRDITAHKQAEEMLKRSEEKYRFLAENMNDNIFTMDLNLRTTYVSPSMKKILGFTPEERMKQHITEQVTPASMTLIGEILSEELEREQKGLGDPNRSIKFEVEYYHKNGSTVWMENVISGIRDDRGVLIGIHGVSRDITERRRSEYDLKESFERLRKSLGATVQAIALTVETKDPYTAGHQRRVADLARSIATEMRLSSEQIEGLRMGGLIHDIGKVSVPAEILSTTRKLIHIEFDLIKTHSQSGYDILKDIEFPWPIARMVLEHHERMNGSGYPNGLTGDNLLLESRILAVADVVESMASHRPYRPALSIEKALVEIENNKGILYDNVAVDACLRLFRDKDYKLKEVGL